jgi:hypothetical protein
VKQAQVKVEMEGIITSLKLLKKEEMLTLTFPLENFVEIGVGYFFST